MNNAERCMLQETTWVPRLCETEEHRKEMVYGFHIDTPQVS